MGCYFKLFPACLLWNIFSLNLLQIFKCRNVAVLTVALNRSMSMTGLEVLTVLEEWQTFVVEDWIQKNWGANSSSVLQLVLVSFLHFPKLLPIVIRTGTSLPRFMFLKNIYLRMCKRKQLRKQKQTCFYYSYSNQNRNLDRRKLSIEETCNFISYQYKDINVSNHVNCVQL